MKVDYSTRLHDGLTREILGCALEVHTALGPGLLESAYEACLCFELQKCGLKIERQKSLPIFYKSIQIDCGYRLDLVVEDSVIIEVKAVDCLAPIHEAQLLTYLKLMNCRIGLLINFNEIVLKNGMRRIIY